MQKSVIILILFCYPVMLPAQDKLKTYKAKIDSLLAKEFDQSLLSFIKLTDVVITTGGPGKARFINYESNKNKQVSFANASFFFEFYSLQVKYTFRFYYKIDRDKKLITDSDSSIGIPACLRQNEACNFISQDSAKIIAVNDSMLYTDNLTIEMVQEHKKEVYYWLLTARPKPGTKDLTVKKNAFVRQRRLIHVKTGFIQSR